MEKKDKQLLLEDLCARLPYGCMLRVEGDWFDDEEREPYDCKLTPYSFMSLVVNHDCDVKPYLRSLTDMTKEEVEEYNQLWDDDRMKVLTLGKELAEEYKKKEYDSIWPHPVVPIYKHIDWLNSHHFDYRGLIEKGLAIKVTPENNPYK